MASSKFSVESLPSLKGKVYLVTGGNSGCGEATVLGLASRGAKVYLAARSEIKANASIEKIRQQVPDADVHFLELDLGSFASVIAAAKRFRSAETMLHGLINNAGIMGTPFVMTKDGFEEQWQTNYMCHWLLTHHLLPVLRETAKSSETGEVRIVNLTSSGHIRFALKTGINFDDLSLESHNGMTRYGQSKLANILHAKQLNKLYGPRPGNKAAAAAAQAGEILVSAVHPGYIMTNLNNKATAMSPLGSEAALRLINRFLLCVGVLTDDWTKGALSSLWAAASPDFGAGGAYVVPYAKVGTPSAQARDAELAGRLWSWTEEEFGRRGLLAPSEQE